MGVDWKEVHRRREAGAEALLRAFDPDPDTLARVLRARAQVYARIESKKRQKTATVPILVVRVGEGEYGIPLGKLAQVVAGLPFTLLPSMAEGVVGVARFDRQDWLILRLAHLLGIAGKEADEEPFCLLRDYNLGFSVTRAERLERIAPELLCQRSTGARFTAGVTPDDIRILDIDAVIEAAQP